MDIRMVDIDRVESWCDQILLCFIAYNTFLLHNPINSHHKIDVYGSTYNKFRRGDAIQSQFANMTINIIKKLNDFSFSIF